MKFYKNIRPLKWIVVVLGALLLTMLLPKCKTSENFFLKIDKEKVESVSGNEANRVINIDGNRYFLIRRIVYQEFYPIIERPPREILSYEYYLLNADTNAKMYPHRNMYVLTKEGLIKTNRVPEFGLASDGVVYNNSIYYLIDMPTNEPLTDCKVFNWYNDKAAKKGKNPYPNEYTYIARFDKQNNRFIIDSTAVYLLSEREKDRLERHKKRLKGEIESVNWASYQIDHMKKFDCNK